MPLKGNSKVDLPRILYVVPSRHGGSVMSFAYEEIESLVATGVESELFVLETHFSSEVPLGSMSKTPSANLCVSVRTLFMCISARWWRF
jgi:hypothetical protein